MSKKLPNELPENVEFRNSNRATDPPQKNSMRLFGSGKKLKFPFSLKAESHQVILVSLGFVLVGIPMMLFKNDVWDGVIIEYNLQEKNLEPLRTWFFSSGWEMQYYLLRFQGTVSESLNLSSRGLILGISLVALIILSNEVYLLARNTFRLTKRSAMFCSILLLLQPTWNVLVSSVMNFHIVCLSLGIMGCRLFIDFKMSRKIMGALLIIIGFQLNSMLLFIPTLIFAVKFIERLDHKQVIMQKRSFIVALGMAVIYFFLQRTFNPNEGAYVYYNEIIIPNSADALKLYLRGILNFTSFLLFPFLAIATTIPTSISNHGFFGRRQEFFGRKVLSLLMLCAAASAPYILVGKSTNVFDLTDWSQRQSFIISIPVVILTGLLLSERYEAVVTRESSQVQMIKSGLILILSCSLLLNSFAIKLNRQIFERKLISSIQEVAPNPEPGLFQINGVSIPGPAFRTYESNFLLYRAYSNASWWSLIQETTDLSFSLPTNQGTPNAGWDVYQPSVDECSSLVKITSSGFERSVTNVIQNFLGRDSGSVRVLEFKTLCGPRQVFYYKGN